MNGPACLILAMTEKARAGLCYFRILAKMRQIQLGPACAILESSPKMVWAYIWARVKGAYDS